MMRVNGREADTTRRSNGQADIDAGNRLLDAAADRGDAWEPPLVEPGSRQRPDA